MVKIQQKPSDVASITCESQPCQWGSSLAMLDTPHPKHTHTLWHLCSCCSLSIQMVAQFNSASHDCEICFCTFVLPGTLYTLLLGATPSHFSQYGPHPQYYLYFRCHRASVISQSSHLLWKVLGKKVSVGQISPKICLFDLLRFWKLRISCWNVKIRRFLCMSSFSSKKINQTI
jgi:hypothetical protein